jgi:glycosyltransferase involved in cell wall biosynthesis
MKEVSLLYNSGYEIKVLCSYYVEWARSFDEEITAKYPGVFIYRGGDPLANPFKYFMTRVRHKIANKLAGIIKLFGIPENAGARAHAELLRQAKKMKSDLYIAHNLGALPAAVLAAAYHGAKVGYDAEDIHSGQNYAGESAVAVNRYIEETYFPGLCYFTAAGNQIAAYYQQKYTYLSPIVINNVFPTGIGIKKPTPSNPGTILNLFWFSQTIGPMRGLEDVITALAETAHYDIRLHLLGNLAPGEYYEYLKKQVLLSEGRLLLHAPVAPDRIPAWASGFDVGLALEPGFDINNERALSNKIFTYLQAGLALITSDTLAQKEFMGNYPQTGRLYGRGNIAELKASWELAATELNWEKEGETFIGLIRRELNENEVKLA